MSSLSPVPGHGTAEERDPRFHELDREILLHDLESERRRRLGIHRKPNQGQKLLAITKMEPAPPELELRPKHRDLALFNRRMKKNIILQALEARTGIEQHTILYGLKTDEISQARQLAYWLMRELTTSSLEEIGSLLGGKHHTTVLHGIRKVDMRRKKWVAWRNLCNLLIYEINTWYSTANTCPKCGAIKRPTPEEIGRQNQEATN